MSDETPPFKTAQECHAAGYKKVVEAYKLVDASTDIAMKYDEDKWAVFADVIRTLMIVYGDPTV